jgi:hypothetical protein
MLNRLAFCRTDRGVATFAVEDSFLGIKQPEIIWFHDYERPFYKKELTLPLKSHELSNDNWLIKVERR